MKLQHSRDAAGTTHMKAYLGAALVALLAASPMALFAQSQKPVAPQPQQQIKPKQQGQPQPGGQAQLQTQPPSSPGVNLFNGLSPWGSITSIEGATAVAAAKPVAALTAALGAQRPQMKTSGSGSSEIKQVTLKLPPACGTTLGGSMALGQPGATHNCLPEPAKPGQTVFLGSSSGSQVQAGLASFPIQVPDGADCVDHGPTNSCFWVRWGNLTISNRGYITGLAQINSDDYLEGFTGNLGILLLDSNGEVLYPTVQVGCWGVNPRSGRQEPINASVPPDIAVQAVHVKVYGYNSGCGDKTADFFKELVPAAEAAAAIIPVIAAL